jgi:hypothetical protein
MPCFILGVKSNATSSGSTAAAPPPRVAAPKARGLGQLDGKRFGLRCGLSVVEAWRGPDFAMVSP